jgi:predicted TIM-barrel fold metal-dependent hydrolase
MTGHPRYEGPVIDCHVHVDRTTLGQVPHVARVAGVEALVHMFDSWPPPRYGEGLDDWRAAEPLLRRAWAPDLARIGEPAFARELVDDVHAAVRQGCVGLKVWKDLGLTLVDARGARVAVDDERLVPLWEVAAEESLPVVIHVGDPPEFWQPLDDDNPRRNDLVRQPQCWYGRGGFPSLAQVQAELERTVAGNPACVFVGAHAGCFLTWSELDRWFATYGNFHVDTSAAVAELGKGDVSQVRELFARWPDRFLFGTDLVRTARGDYPDLQAGRWDLAEYYHRDAGLQHPIPEQTPWTVTGLDLSDEVLGALYRGNAARVFGRGLA